MQYDSICLTSLLDRQAVGFTDNLDPAKMAQGLSWGFAIISPLLSLNPASPLLFGAHKIRDSAFEEVTIEGHFGKGPGSVISNHPEHIQQWRSVGVTVCMSQRLGNWGKNKVPHALVIRISSAHHFTFSHSQNPVPLKKHTHETYVIPRFCAK